MFFPSMEAVAALARELAGRCFPPKSLMYLIRRLFKNTVPSVKFSLDRDHRVDAGTVVVSGTYDKDLDQAGLPAIEIILCFNPEDQLLESNQIDWQVLAFDLAECMCHEYIHQMQSRKKTHNQEYVSQHEHAEQRAEQEYLGHEREIDAYAFSIAAEHVVFNRPINECAMYRVYTYTFDNDPAVVVQLDDNISKYLIHLGNENDKNASR